MCDICDNNRYVLRDGKLVPCVCSIKSWIYKIVGWFGLGEINKQTINGELTVAGIEPYMFYRPARGKVTLDEGSKFMRWAMVQSYLKWKLFAKQAEVLDIMERSFSTTEDIRNEYLTLFYEFDFVVLFLGISDKNSRYYGNTIIELINTRRLKGLKTWLVSFADDASLERGYGDGFLRRIVDAGYREVRFV